MQHAASAMLRRWTGSGLAVASALSGQGKTVVAGAIAYSLRQEGLEVGAIKPIDNRCVHRREGLVSEDAEMLAHRGDVRFPLDLVCPIRRHGGLVTALAGGDVDWDQAQRSLDIMDHNVGVLVAEMPDGLMTPVTSKHTGLDIARWLGMPVVLVMRGGEEAMNLTLLSLEALRAGGVSVAGIVLNAHNAEKASVADERLLGYIERWTKARLLAVLPEEKAREIVIGPGIAEAMAKVDWMGIAQGAG